jgi:hypothetical protein
MIPGAKIQLISANTEGSAVQGAQLVLFCVKSSESGAAAI